MYAIKYVLADGASAEIAVTGNEGLVGTALFSDRHAWSDPIGMGSYRSLRYE